MTVQSPNSRVIRRDTQCRPTSTLYPKSILPHRVVQTEFNICQVIKRKSPSTSPYNLELVAMEVIRMVDGTIKIIDDNSPCPHVGKSCTGYQCALVGITALDHGKYRVEDLVLI